MVLIFHTYGPLEFQIYVKTAYYSKQELYVKEHCPTKIVRTPMDGCICLAWSIWNFSVHASQINHN
jgi:hypothetical protein